MFELKQSMLRLMNKIDAFLLEKTRMTSQRMGGGGRGGGGGGGGGGGEGGGVGRASIKYQGFNHLSRIRSGPSLIRKPKPPACSYRGKYINCESVNN